MSQGPEGHTLHRPCPEKAGLNSAASHVLSRLRLDLRIPTERARRQLLQGKNMPKTAETIVFSCLFKLFQLPEAGFWKCLMRSERQSLVQACKAHALARSPALQSSTASHGRPQSRLLHCILPHAQLRQQRNLAVEWPARSAGARSPRAHRAYPISRTYHVHRTSCRYVLVCIQYVF